MLPSNCCCRPFKPAVRPAAGSTGALQGFSSGFDFSAPAVKIVSRPDAPGGIPDMELFALRVPGTGLLGVAAAGAFFGIKGLLAAALLGESRVTGIMLLFGWPPCGSCAWPHVAPLWHGCCL